FRSLFTLAFVATLASLSAVAAKEPALLIKKGEKIAFMGDSITQSGNRKNGYVTLVMDALNREGLKVTHVPAGVSG
ncbi:MAG: hypothetical protein ACPG4K_14690, partial [Haloferula sp.]